MKVKTQEHTITDHVQIKDLISGDCFMHDDLLRQVTDEIVPHESDGRYWCVSVRGGVMRSYLPTTIVKRVYEVKIDYSVMGVL